VNDPHGNYARLRHTATGAVAALAAVGVIAGTAALAAQPPAKTHRHAAVTQGSTTKTPAPPIPGQAQRPQAGSDQPFLTTVQRLVNDGTITATQAQAVDRQIRAGSLEPQTLASIGFTPTQLQAVEQTLANTKRALATAATGAPAASKQPLSAGAGAPGCAKQPPPAASANDRTPK
jgi:hypothetical protein